MSWANAQCVYTHRVDTQNSSLSYRFPEAPSRIRSSFCSSTDVQLVKRNTVTSIFRFSQVQKVKIIFLP